MKTFETFDAFCHCNKDRTASDSDELIYALFGLWGETGEIGESIKKTLRRTSLNTADLAHDLHSNLEDCKIELLMEAGDVLYYLSRLVFTLGSTLEEVAKFYKVKSECRDWNGKNPLLEKEMVMELFWKNRNE